MKPRKAYQKYASPPSTFRIQITSMVDMFVILLVFLLKNFSTAESVPEIQLKSPLPSSQIARAPTSGNKLVLNVEDGKARLAETQISLTAGHHKVKDEKFLPELYKALKGTPQQPLLIQAAKNMEYNQLQKVLYTCAVAGFKNVSLAVLSQI